MRLLRTWPSLSFAIRLPNEVLSFRMSALCDSRPKDHTVGPHKRLQDLFDLLDIKTLPFIPTRIPKVS